MLSPLVVGPDGCTFWGRNVEKKRLRVKGREFHENIVLEGWTERMAALRSGGWTRKEYFDFLEDKAND